MSKIDPLASIVSGYAGAVLLDANFEKIETALENTLSRDGSTPNNMTADLDMDGNRILNLPVATDNTEPVRFDQVTDLVDTAAQEFFDGIDLNTVLAATECICIACSDEVTTVTTGTAKVTFRMPYAFTLTQIPRASLSTASGSGAVTIDINESGTSILSTKLTVDANETTSVAAATPAVLSDTGLADNAEITVDFDGAGTGAKGVKVYLIGRKAG